MMVARVSQLLMLLCVPVFVVCSQAETNKPEVDQQQANEPDANKPETIRTESGLEYIDLKVGDGDEAFKDLTVDVHYTGWLYENGKRGIKFDSSVDRGKPFTFTLGGGQVIKGWDEGVEGMKVGGKRELIIPASLGYGSQGAAGVIPPNATLDFEVELLKVTSR